MEHCTIRSSRALLSYRSTASRSRTLHPLLHPQTPRRPLHPTVLVPAPRPRLWKLSAKRGAPRAQRRVRRAFRVPRVAEQAAAAQTATEGDRHPMKEDTDEVKTQQAARLPLAATAEIFARGTALLRHHPSRVPACRHPQEAHARINQTRSQSAHAMLPPKYHRSQPNETTRVGKMPGPITSPPISPPRRRT